MDHPGVIAPPPVIFLVAFVLGWLGRSFVPEYRSFVTGAALALLGAVLFVWAAREMVRAKTHIDPRRPAVTLVTTGPFRFTRNPLYISANLLYAAAALVLGLTASLILLPIANSILVFGVIRREERYLESKFGDAYRVYRSKVRRWL